MLDTGEEVELKVEGDEVAVAEEIPAIEAEADIQDGTEPKAEDDPGEEPEELVVSFEGEEPQPEEEEGTPIIRILRKQLREAQRQLKDAQKAKPADMKRIEDLHNKLEKHAASKSVETYFELNCQFHES